MPSNPDIRALQLQDWEDEEESTNITAVAPDLQRDLATKLEARPCFIVLAGSNVGETYPIEQPETTLGRSTQTTLRFNDDGVSRKHARVILVKDQVIIEDLGSANGTFVNGDPIMSHGLKDGDKVRLGSTTVLRFTYHDTLDEKFQQQMYDAALRDGLTQCFNKKYLVDRLNTELAYAARHKSLLSLILFDVDHFKKVNDTFGHLAGDHVLKELAKIVSGALRAEDVLARYGGEEFAVICRGIPLAHTGVLAERLRVLVEAKSFDFMRADIPVTISLGVATFPDIEAKTVDQLIGAADEALYEAKRSGRNRFVLKK
ncbi:MAG: diguanylate cyclase [Myxococcaceae bacterium]|jgi:two-component system cell cycle response regulator|nr:diguanylate cyclase [Myxococcaceae bacterium]